MKSSPFYQLPDLSITLGISQTRAYVPIFGTLADRPAGRWFAAVLQANVPSRALRSLNLDQRDRPREGARHATQITIVRGQNGCSVPAGHQHDVDVDDVGHPGSSCQCADLMGVTPGERYDLAAP